MALIWVTQLSVRNAMLDSEHKSLIGMVNNIEYAIGAKDGSALLKTIKLFEDEANTHFANEARFAQSFNFHFEQHDLAHLRFQEELRQKTDELAAGIDSAGVGAWPEHVFGFPQFLGDWLVGHIICDDMKMKPVLQSLPYNFVA